ncbi:MAG: alkaline phosphatase family protein [Actinomycetota bacterium]|nr:alkaline phosphatase family protein [Actinomycetota bacterium]
MDKTSTGSRLMMIVIGVALVGVPALVFRALCLGNSCDEPINAASEVPFCSLPEHLRTAIVRGFRDEPRRSPDLLAVTREQSVIGGTGFEDRGRAPAWPSLARTESSTVPIIFWGRGVDPDAEVPAGTGVEDVSETLAAIISFKRPDPHVRSGEAVAGVAEEDAPSLVVSIVLKGVGTEDLEREPNSWPEIQTLMDEGAGTLRGSVGSLPLDPTAVLTTIGTGGYPSEHGIVGTLVRNDQGELVRAWGPRSPIHIIATLGDHLDERTRQRSKIGLVQTAPTDRGLIGGNWYVDVDQDEVTPASPDPAGAARSILKRGYGTDSVPDLLAVALDGPIEAMDAAVGAIVGAAEKASNGSVAVAVAASGSNPPATEAPEGPDAVVRPIERALPGAERVVEATAVGGLFLDQEVLSRTGITEDEVLKLLDGVEDGSGEKLMADAFPAVAVFFSRYC